MKPDCNILNPLLRDGLSQDRRLIRALHPSHVAVDERDISDLLLYAKEYAQLIQYYSLENNPSGDWKKFIESDITTLVAMIVKFDSSIFKTRFDEAANYLEQFSEIIDLAAQVYSWYANSIKELKLHSALERVIGSILEPSLISAIAYAKRIENIDISFQVSDLNIDLGSIGINDIQADTTLFLSGDINNSDEALSALRKIKRSFQTIYESVLSIVIQASGFLEETLKEYHQHYPHIALFLAFLKLFETAQNHLNTITKRHLDYYYQEVLQLDLRPEQSDQVHIVFELAKSFNTHLIDKDTLLKAGKDDTGANVFFGLDNDIVINKTKRFEDGLKTIFIDKVYDTGADNPNLVSKDTPYQIRNIYAAAKANSLDGIEEELEEEGKWLTFGDQTMPHGGVGFAISSPILLLREGTREITATFTFSIDPDSSIVFTAGNDINNEIANELMHNLKLAYSSEEEWVTKAIKSVEFRIPGSDLIVEFKVELSPEDPPFIAYDKTKLTPGFATSKPTLKFTLINNGLSGNSIDSIVPHPVPSLTISDFLNDAKTYIEGGSFSQHDKVVFGNEYYYALIDPTTNKPTAGLPFWKKIDKSYPYKYFQALHLKKTDLTVNVTGMKDLVLENDIGILNPAKPFMPFGPIPKIGSKFYIGSPEVFSKDISSITLDLEWADLPTSNFDFHYNAYQEPFKNTNTDTVNSNFKVSAELLTKGVWESNPLSPNILDLFQDDIEIDSPKKLEDSTIKFIGVSGDTTLENFKNFTPDLISGFLRLQLKKDFLHKQFPIWMGKAAALGAAGKFPNEPYTPTIGSFSLDYTASSQLNHSIDIYEDSVSQFFHITPFGYQAFYPNATDLPKEKAVFSDKLIPEFEMTDIEDIENPETTDAEGTLFIGLKDLVPEQNVSLLFQMAEGSADPDLPKEEISWSYLSFNRWVDFDRTQIISDSTNDLLTSGIVTLTMPKDMTRDNTILPAETYWIKVSVARKVKAVSQSIEVLPQAVKASFRKTIDNDLGRLSNPLPEETIGKLKERQAKVKTVLQPFSSFNGKLIEQNETPESVIGDDRFDKDYNEFYIRVSERLRHKNRAVAIDDYERIVLQQFSDVYKVKCINHTRIEADDDGVVIPPSEHAPGFVKLIVVPNLRNRNAVNPLQPKVSSNRLDEIKKFLTPLKSDFVTLEVKNPMFEEVAVDFKVRLHEGFDKGFYTKLLKKDIVKFLSPWLYDEGADLPIGGKIHRSVILNFVEETEYVDYVTDFKLNHYIPGKPDLLDIEEAIATTSSSVIVSKAATVHAVDPDTIEDC